MGSVRIVFPTLARPHTSCSINNNISDLGSTGLSCPLGLGPLLSVLAVFEDSLLLPRENKHVCSPRSSSSLLPASLISPYLPWDQWTVWVARHLSPFPFHVQTLNPYHSWGDPSTSGAWGTSHLAPYQSPLPSAPATQAPSAFHVHLIWPQGIWTLLPTSASSTSFPHIASPLAPSHFTNATSSERSSFFFSFIFISWRLITLQYCSGFCLTLTWISHGFTCVPHPEPPSHLPPHPIPLGLPSAPAPSTCLMHPAWTGDLFHTW